MDQTFKLQLLHATICPSVAQRLQRSLSLQLSTTHASMFPFCLTFGALDFHFGYLSLSIFRSFPFDFASLSGFSSLQLIQLRIFLSIDLFFNFSFVSSRSIQFHRCNPKSRRHDPCSKDFREVTHRCCTSKYVRSLQS